MRRKNRIDTLDMMRRLYEYEADARGALVVRAVLTMGLRPREVRGLTWAGAWGTEGGPRRALVLRSTAGAAASRLRIVPMSRAFVIALSRMRSPSAIGIGGHLFQVTRRGVVQQASEKLITRAWNEAIRDRGLPEDLTMNFVRQWLYLEIRKQKGVSPYLLDIGFGRRYSEGSAYLDGAPWAHVVVAWHRALVQLDGMGLLAELLPPNWNAKVTERDRRRTRGAGAEAVHVRGLLGGVVQTMKGKAR